MASPEIISWIPYRDVPEVSLYVDSRKFPLFLCFGSVQPRTMEEYILQSMELCIISKPDLEEFVYNAQETAMLKSLSYAFITLSDIDGIIYTRSWNPTKRPLPLQQIIEDLMIAMVSMHR